MINLFQPYAAGIEVAAVEDVFASNWLGRGPRVEQFERAFGEYIGRADDDLVAVSSCTEGLFHAIAALGLGAGDDVVLPSISFVGAAHAVRDTGARVVLCDVDSPTLSPTAEQVEAAITPATRVLLTLHYGGHPGHLEEIAKLAKDRSLLLVEDAAVGLGSSIGSRACGTLGEVGVWSFDSMKVLTTADGGMIWCRRHEIAEHVRRSTRLGVGSSGIERSGGAERWWELDPLAVGRRGHMNDLSAAIGLVQLDRLPGFLRRRAQIAYAYDRALADVPWLTPPPKAPSGSARLFYWIQTEPALRDRLATHMLAHEVYTTFQYWPLHRMRMYASAGGFPGADRAAASTLLLPLHQGLSERDVEQVLEAVRSFRP